MVYTIVLMWMAVQMQAPTWIFVILGIMLTLQIVSSICEVLTKIEKRKRERRLKALKEMANDLDSMR